MARKFNPDRDAPVYRGQLYRYDLLKEASLAFGAVLVLVVLLSILFSSPDPKPITFQSWARTDPADFADTTLSELDGTSETATYGPPYNDGSGSTQKLAGVCFECVSGTVIPVDAARDFITAPLSTQPQAKAAKAALAAWQAAPAARQAAWARAGHEAITNASFSPTGKMTLPPGPYGPVGAIIGAQYAAAVSGSLDGAMLYTGNNPANQFFRLDYTKPLLYLEDGHVLDQPARANGLLGNQWGLMNETGGWPGQFWLVAYAFPYQISTIGNSQNADILAISFIAILSLLLIFTPFIPGWRAIPRVIPIHRLIWRRWYRDWDPDRPGAPPDSRAP